MSAYVLVNATPGHALELAQRIRDVQGVQAADAITGEYDIVVTCEFGQVLKGGASRSPTSTIPHGRGSPHLN